MRRAAAGLEAHSIVNGRWSWSAGAELANRNFRNFSGHNSPGERAFFTAATSVAGWLSVERTLVRVPERRFIADSSAKAKAGREFAAGAGAVSTLPRSRPRAWFVCAK